MTIIEAIKSGKRFRQQGQTEWLEWLSCHPYFTVTKAMLFADDWEVEEKKVEITKPRLLEALKAVRMLTPLDGWIKDLCEELGLD